MATLNVFGLLFDTRTGKVTLDDGSPPVVGQDFTFEYHEGQNPLQFATEETAEKLVKILKPVLPGIDITFKRALPVPYGGPPAVYIHFSRFGIESVHNAGLIANAFIRSGNLNFIKAELKTAGILF